MGFANRVSKIEVGEKVAYKASFLRNTGQTMGDIPHARGVVTEVKQYGDMAIASIEWDREGIPEKVNVANLSKVTVRGLADE